MHPSSCDVGAGDDAQAKDADDVTMDLLLRSLRSGASRVISFFVSLLRSHWLSDALPSPHPIDSRLQLEQNLHTLRLQMSTKGNDDRHEEEGDAGILVR